MGTQYSSDIQVRRITEGILFHFFHIKGPIQIFNMKLFVIAAVCLAASVSAEAAADAVSQLIISLANVKPKPMPHLTTDMVDTDMVAMDTDTVTDTAVDTDMVTPLVRDLLMLNHTTDTHTLTTVTDTTHTPSLLPHSLKLESLDTQPEPLILKEAYKESANRF